MSDVIIVLGRGIKEDGSLPIDPKSRINKAVELYNNKVAPFVVMSGAWTYHLDINPSQSEAQAMKEYAIKKGIPGSAIIEESKSKDTIGNVYFTKKDIVEPRGFRDITIISSEDHMPRVKYLFQKIYGDTYILRFVTSRRVLDDAAYEKEMAHEYNSMAITRAWLDSLTPGDDVTLWNLMTTIHPAYMPQGLHKNTVNNDEDQYKNAP